MSIKVFISYAIESEEHTKKVISLANKLKFEGINVHIFKDIKLGERIQYFMEQIDKCDFTLFICTPEYKKKADKRLGGVGYEWNIITTGVAMLFDERKLIPVLFSGDWTQSMPIWARGKMGIDYRESSEEEFQKLIQTFISYEDEKNSEIIDIEDEDDGIETDSTSFKDRKMMVIDNEDGEDEVVEVLLHFELTDVQREYIVYTKNEVDQDENVTIYTATIQRSETGISLGSVPDSDWPRIKNIMRELATDDDDD